MSSDAQIKVRVLFFGAARDAVGQDEIEFAMKPGADTAGARAQLLAAYPGL
jgi:molybdopterin converting factor small subunit